MKGKLITVGVFSSSSVSCTLVYRVTPSYSKTSKVNSPILLKSAKCFMVWNEFVFQLYVVEFIDLQIAVWVIVGLLLKLLIKLFHETLSLIFAQNYIFWVRKLRKERMISVSCLWRAYRLQQTDSHKKCSVFARIFFQGYLRKRRCCSMKADVLIKFSSVALIHR